MESFEPYGLGIAALVLFTMIVMVLSPVSAAAKQAAGLQPGATPDQDYSSRLYRLHRAHGNGVETLTVFATIVFASILAGVSPFWVNLLAWIVLFSRIAMVPIHVNGTGKPNMGPRTYAFVVGVAAYFVLALLALLAALF